MPYPSNHRVLNDLPAMGGPVSQFCNEFRPVDQLADIVVHADVQAGFLILRKGVGGHADDRRSACRAGQSADLAGGLQPIQFRHLHIHQDQVVAATGRLPDGGESVVGHIHPAGEAGIQNGEGGRLVDRIVLHQQQAAGIGGFCGRAGWRRCLVRGRRSLITGNRAGGALREKPPDREVAQGLVQAFGKSQRAGLSGSAAGPAATSPWTR